MSGTQKISCVLWFLGAAGLVFALVSSGWMTLGDDVVSIGLRGLGHRSWSELEAELGAARSEAFETAAFLGPVVFWGGFAVVVAMLPAAWYFRYGKNVGRVWVGIVNTAIAIAGIGFCFSVSDSKLHYPVAVFFVGIAIVLVGCFIGFAEPKQDPRSKPLEF
jgi:hypothetical protein